ncbi:hypothetical protein GGX14DRAFT_556129 [Mycena pura]|uniref:Uncharacterized protein n=1 Tax=Mycena pura TaxID=153505 RepID=A0AAD6YPI8_9AGAR|nr:hypothetical protein GGX14DRAFT_556129 [Mycena pura]
MALPSLLQRFLDIEAEFLDAPSLDKLSPFFQKWVRLQADFQSASNPDPATVDAAQRVASEISIFSGSLLSFHAEADAQVNKLLKLNLDVDSDEPVAQIPSPPSSPGTSSDSSPAAKRADSTSCIEPAYKWLLNHLRNPYPKKENKEKIADLSGCSVERVSEWFIDVRRRIGWTRLLREEFGGKRADMVEVAARYFHPGSTEPLPLDIQARFLEVETLARDIYGHGFIPSALSNKTSAAVKDLTPELQEKARQERLEMARAANSYPSPAPSGLSSPISDPGASTSLTVLKRAAADAFDDDESVRKIDEGSSISPPVSATSSAAPSTRKRRLSESDASGPSKRPRRNVSNPIPATISLSGTPELLADWFSDNYTGDMDLFDPGSLVDITFFDPADYFPENDEALAATQSITQRTTVQAPTEPDMLAFGLTPEIQQLLDPSSSANPDVMFASYAPFDTGPTIYEPEPFMEPFFGSYNYEYNCITPESAAESLGLPLHALNPSFPDESTPFIVL